MSKTAPVKPAALRAAQSRAATSGMERWGRASGAEPP